MAIGIAALLLANTFFAVAIGLASRSRSFLLLLLGYSVVLSLGGALSLADSLPTQPGGTPYLAGSDGEGYFDDAAALSQAGIGNFRELIAANYAGYQIFLAAWFIAFGPILAVGLIANNLLLMLSVLALFRATQLLTGSRQAGLLACAALMLTPAHVFHSLTLLKEPAIGLAFSLLLLAVTLALKQPGAGLRAALLFTAGVVIIAAMRGTMLLAVFLLLGCFGTLFAKQRWHLLLALAGLLALLAPLAQEFTSYALDAAFIADTVTLNTVVAATLQDGGVDTAGVVGRISGAYLALPFTAKVALFFVPALLQLVLPFDFWSAAFLDDHFSALFVRNLNPLWYLYVAVWALFALFALNRTGELPLRRFLLAGAIGFALIAVIYGGAIPRYAAPMLYFVYPAVGYWWDRSRREPAVRARARRFFFAYYAGLLVLLVLYLAFNLMRQL